MLLNNRTSVILLQKNLGTLLRTGYSPIDIIQAVLSQWITRKFPALRDMLKTMDTNSEPAIRAFANVILDLDLFTSAFWLSSAYAELLGKTEKKSNSLYFTPPYLSQRVLNNIGEALFRGKLIDPACGGAAFLVPAAVRIVDHLLRKRYTAEEILSYLEENIHGCDIDPFLCKLSSIFLKMALSKQIESAGRMPVFKIRTANGLSAFKKLVGTFNLVLCNPPYRKLSRAEAMPLQKKYTEIMRVGQPNIYSLFIGRSMRLLQDKGVAALLTPMSFVSGLYYSGVRREVARVGTIQQFDLIRGKQGVFLGAEQDTVITVWQKEYAASNKATKIYTLWLNGDCEFNGQIKILKGSDSPWPIPRCLTDDKLMALFEKREFDLESYGYKPRTGAIVIHRDTRARYRDANEAKSAKYPIPIIWSADIRQDGKLDLDVCSKNDARFIDMRDEDSTSVVKGPTVALQRVTAPEQKRRLVCAPVPDSFHKKYGGIVGENHVCLIERVSSDSEISPDFLSSILRTEVVDRLFRCISGVTNVSAYELMHLPLPDPYKVAEYITMGLSMDDAVLRAFGLDEPPASADTKKERLTLNYGDQVDRGALHQLQ